MKNLPKVSVIVTTKNEESNIITCLESIKAQSYSNSEIIVVDNNSVDQTVTLAKKYTPKVFSKGPERSAQRNFGAFKATGRYLLFIDADMKLSRAVVESCVKKNEEKEVGGIIIPEISYGEGIWAKAKAFERSFYVGNDAIEAARFFKKTCFEEVKGFDLTLTGPEDWDLSQRIKKRYGLTRINDYIMHNEGKLSLRKTLEKKYYYSKKLSTYMGMKRNEKYVSKQLHPLSRYMIFFNNPKKLFASPFLATTMLIMKTLEMSAGLIGIYLKK